jgi:hypothetical protein
MTDAAMTNTVTRRNQRAWIGGVLIRPRSTFREINATGERSWLLPMLVLSLTALIYILARGWVTGHLAAQGEAPLPQDWQYWTPDMQQQFQQAQQATQGPVFVYLIPALGSMISLWGVWLLVASFLRLTLTLLGGHNTETAMNVAAWAGLPFALRDLLRAGYIFVVQRPIVNLGLSGFVMAPNGGVLLFGQKLLMFADIFTIWYILLLVIGVRAGTPLSPVRAATAVLIVVLVVFAARAALAVLGSSAGGLMITRPFF